MKNPLFKYSIYLLSVITVVMFFIMGFYPYEMEIPTIIVFITTVVLYSLYCLIAKQISKIEIIYDTIMFLTFNIIGFGFAAFYVTLLPYTFYTFFVNFFITMLCVVGYIISLVKCFGQKKEKGIIHSS